MLRTEGYIYSFCLTYNLLVPGLGAQAYIYVHSYIVGYISRLKEAETRETHVCVCERKTRGGMPGDYTFKASRESISGD